MLPTDMFIPRGTVLHENLATSYVLVDGLVADLCEGGFSGVVEIMLRDTDVRIVIARGHVAAAIESHDSDASGSIPITRSYLRTTVADLALASRRERGRVSIYSYNAQAASAIAERINGEPLYTRLSTDFADIEKMIFKLSRERDRQWFIEVSTENGLDALIRIKDEGCLILTAQEGQLQSESETFDLASNQALRDLFDDCKQFGGVFDVYFRSAADSEISFESEPAQSGSLIAQTAAAADVNQAMMEAKAVFESLSVEDAAPGPSNGNHMLLPSMDAPASQYERPYDGSKAKETAKMNAVATGGENSSPPFDTGAPAQSSASPDAPISKTDHKARKPELLLVQDDLRATGLLKRGSEADRMAEIKRLMGEITRTIEEATQSAELRDSFPMHLRAGQLKITELYPFLDPFGVEFEYLAGEIVFVGQASPGEFIDGLTEALKFAVEAAVKSSAQPARLRARIVDELEWLLKNQRIEFEQHGLNQSVEEIIKSAAKG